MERKKYLKPVLIILCAILILLAAGIGGLTFYRNAYISINGAVYSRTAAELDLSGVAEPELEKIPELSGLKQLDLRDTSIRAEDYEALQAALPECEILWSVPFQGGYLSSDTEEITLTTLSPNDLPQFAYLPRLRTVHAQQCRDYDQLLALREANPQLELSYLVPIQGQGRPMDTAELTLTDADAQELSRMLPYLPQLQTVTLEGALPEAEALRQLTAAFPGIRFYWQIELFGQTADVDTVELDLSNIPMESVEEVERKVAYLPSLEKVIMSDCGISDEEMDALNRRHENILFVWTVQLGPLRLRTDATSFMPTKEGYILNDRACCNLRYCTEMVCLDLGHHEISNCDFVAFMPKLKYLILIDMDISDITPLANHEELVFLELFLTRVRDYTPLLTCTNLQDLNICYTYGDMEVICQMTWLDNLWWSPGHTWKYETLHACLPDTYLELDTRSSTGQGWRQLPNYYAQRDIFGMPYADD